MLFRSNPIYARVLWTSGSSDTADTITWKVLYQPRSPNNQTLTGTIGLPLSTPIPQDTVPTGTAYTLCRTEKGTLDQFRYLEHGAFYAIGALAGVDHVAVGLGDLGRSDGWAERQVGRWRKQLEGYSELPGYPGPEIPGVDRVGEWLDARLPRNVRIGIIHGDFHFSNVMMAFDSPQLAAIVDWELVTLGDPLLDLGHVLSLWPDQIGRAHV